MGMIPEETKELLKPILSSLTAERVLLRGNWIEDIKLSIATAIALNAPLRALPYNTSKVRIEFLHVELSEADVLSIKVLYSFMKESTTLDEVPVQFIVKNNISGCLHIDDQDYDLVGNSSFGDACLTLENNPEYGNIPLMEIFETTSFDIDI